MNLNGKDLCANCFEKLEQEEKTCTRCGYLEGKDQPTTTLPVGTMLLGRFLIGKVLGKGGFGVTYLSYDLKKETKVAIKEYMPDSLSYRTPGNTLISTYEGEKEESFKLGAEKFYEEAKTLSRFNGHPNIINVFEFFYENNTAYFVMEYIEGVDLKAYLSQMGGTISEDECLSLLTPMMDALIVIHSVGILHRDISPDNIYVTSDGNVKLLDFGAARQVLGEKSKSLSVVLKPGFAPIEQYQTRGKQGEWTDVYALAATMYFCLTGQIPEAAMDRIEEDNIRPVGEFKPDISSTLDQIILKALAVRAVERYQTIAEFKQAFSALKRPVPEAEASTAVETQRPAETTAPAKKINLRKVLIPVIAVCVIMVLSVAMYGIFGNRQETAEAGEDGGPAVAVNNLSNGQGAIADNEQNSAAASSTATAVSSRTTAANSTAANSTTEVTSATATKAASQSSTAASTTAANTSSTQVQTANFSTENTAAPSKSSQTTTASSQSPASASQAAPSTVQEVQTEKVSGVEYTYVTTKFSVKCTYTGEWKDGKPNGYGELKMIQDVPPYWEPGDRLSGSFVDGLLNGTGKYTGASGGSYNGSFKNGLKNGYGVFIYSDGAKYEGYFKDGEYNGEGTLTFNGDVWKGTWSNGEFQG